jgi:hypothetical protein
MNLGLLKKTNAKVIIKVIKKAITCPVSTFSISFLTTNKSVFALFLKCIFALRYLNGECNKRNLNIFKPAVLNIFPESSNFLI